MPGALVPVASQFSTRHPHCISDLVGVYIVSRWVCDVSTMCWCLQVTGEILQPRWWWRRRVLLMWMMWMMMMMMSVMWNIIASLLFLVAVNRGAVTAVVAEPDGKQLSTIFFSYNNNNISLSDYRCQLCGRNWRDSGCFCLFANKLHTYIKSGTHEEHAQYLYIYTNVLIAALL